MRMQTPPIKNVPVGIVPLPCAPDAFDEIKRCHLAGHTAYPPWCIVSMRTTAATCPPGTPPQDAELYRLCVENEIEGLRRHIADHCQHRHDEHSVAMGPSLDLEVKNAYGVTALTMYGSFDVIFGNISHAFPSFTRSHPRRV